MQRDAIVAVASEMLATLRSGIGVGEVLVARAIDTTRPTATRQEKVAHLLYMCEEIPKLVGQNKLQRAIEYVDFVQGAMWTLLPISLRALQSMKGP